MIGYITVGSNDLEKARGFYDQLMPVLGAGRIIDIGDEKSPRRDNSVNDGQRAREHDQPESGGHELTLLFVLPRGIPDTRIPRVHPLPRI